MNGENRWKAEESLRKQVESLRKLAESSIDTTKAGPPNICYFISISSFKHGGNQSTNPRSTFVPLQFEEASGVRRK